MSDLRLATPRTVECIAVIRTVATRGDGTEKDPIRAVTQYWDGTGKLLAEDDPNAWRS